MTLAIIVDDDDDDCDDTFPINVCLCEGYSGSGEDKKNAHAPEISLRLTDELVECGLPEYLYVELPVLLDEFLEDYWEYSHGEETPILIKMLRDYADKIEADLVKRLEQQ